MLCGDYFAGEIFGGGNCATRANPKGTASCAPQGKGNWLRGKSHRIKFPQLWVKEVGQTGTTARHSTQNGQKCSDDHSPFKRTVHKGNNSPCSIIIPQLCAAGLAFPKLTLPHAHTPLPNPPDFARGKLHHVP